LTSTQRIVARYKLAVIRKEKGEYCVKSPNNPDWNGGCYPSKEKAEERLQQVEYFKHNKSANYLDGGTIVGTDADHVVEIYTTGCGAESIQELLERVQRHGEGGHSFTIRSEGDERVYLGGWDGDGADYISEIRVRALVNYDADQ